MEMSKELQQQLWEEAKCFIENSSRKDIIRLGVTLDGSDDKFMELSFTVPTSDIGYDEFVDLINSDFLQEIRFEYSDVKIQEFPTYEKIEVSYDRFEHEHVVQLSIGDKNTSIFNKFSYWKFEHLKMNSGFKKSTKEFDLIYLQSLKQMANYLGVEFDFEGTDMYDEMLLIEKSIDEYFLKGGEL